MLPFEARIGKNREKIDPSLLIDNHAELVKRGKELYDYFDQAFTNPDHSNLPVVPVSDSNRYTQKLTGVFPPLNTDVIQVAIDPRAPTKTAAYPISRAFHPYASYGMIVIDVFRQPPKADEIESGMMYLRVYPYEAIHTKKMTVYLTSTGHVTGEGNQRSYRFKSPNELNEYIESQIVQTHSLFNMARRVHQQRRIRNI